MNTTWGSRLHVHENRTPNCAYTHQDDTPTTTTHGERIDVCTANMEWAEEEEDEKNLEKETQKKTNKPGKRFQPLAIKIIIREEDLKFYASLRAQNEWTNERPKKLHSQLELKKQSREKRRRNKTRWNKMNRLEFLRFLFFRKHDGVLSHTSYRIYFRFKRKTELQNGLARFHQEQQRQQQQKIANNTPKKVNSLLHVNLNLECRNRLRSTLLVFAVEWQISTIIYVIS